MSYKTNDAMVRRKLNELASKLNHGNDRVVQFEVEPNGNLGLNVIGEVVYENDAYKAVTYEMGEPIYADFNAFQDAANWVLDCDVDVTNISVKYSELYEI